MYSMEREIEEKGLRRQWTARYCNPNQLVLREGVNEKGISKVYITITFGDQDLGTPGMFYFSYIDDTKSSACFADCAISPDNARYLRDFLINHYPLTNGAEHENEKTNDEERLEGKSHEGRANGKENEQSQQGDEAR